MGHGRIEESIGERICSSAHLRSVAFRLNRTVRSENENWRTLYRLREYLPQNEAGRQRLARVVSERKR